MKEIIKNCYLVAFPSITYFKGKPFTFVEEKFVSSIKEILYQIVSSNEFNGSDAKVEMTKPRCLYCLSDEIDYETDEDKKIFDSLNWADEVIANSKTSEGVAIIKKAYADWRAAEGFAVLKPGSTYQCSSMKL